MTRGRLSAETGEGEEGRREGERRERGQWVICDFSLAFSPPARQPEWHPNHEGWRDGWPN